MSDDKIDVSAEIAALCEKLGLTDKTYISEIVLTPLTATATVYRGQDGPYKGSKYIDLETGEPAQDVMEFAITS